MGRLDWHDVSKEHVGVKKSVAIVILKTSLPVDIAINAIGKDRRNRLRTIVGRYKISL